MKNLILMVVAICIATTSFAQKGKLNAAISAYEKGDYKSAYSAIEAASEHKKTKDLPETWVYKAQILSMLKMSPELSSLMGITVNDGELTAALDKAIALDSSGDYTEQLEAAAQVIIDNTHNAGVDAFSNQKNYEAAVDLFEQKLSLTEQYLPNNPVDTMSYLVIGAAHFELDNKEAGVKSYEKLMDLQYDDPGVFNTVINYYKSTNNDEQYLAALKKAQKMYPSDNNYMLMEIDYHIKNGNVDEVLSDMLVAAEKEPNNVNLLLTIANVYKQQENLAEERKWLNKTLEVDPDNGSANFNLGVSYFNEAVKHNTTMNYEMSATTPKYIEAKKQRDVLAKKAFPFFQKAYDDNPKDPGVLQAMVQYHRMYQNEEAKARFEAELDAVTE